MTTQRRRPSARLAARGAGAVQQVQRERRGDQDGGDDAQAQGVAVVGIVAGDLGQQHRHGGERADAADHRRRPLDQVAATAPAG